MFPMTARTLRRAWAVMVVVALWPLDGQAQTTPTVPELKPEWTVKVPGEVNRAVFSADGSCVAVVSIASKRRRSARVTLLDAAGRRAWEFEHPHNPSAVAVAPGCDWVAIGPKLVVTAGGRRKARPSTEHQEGISTSSVTIRRRDGTWSVLVEQAFSVAINRAGDLMAIASIEDGNSRISFVRPGGRVTRVVSVPAMSPEVAFSADGRFLVVYGFDRGLGVLTSEGERVWGFWPFLAPDEQGLMHFDPSRERVPGLLRIHPSRDLQWFVGERGDAPESVVLLTSSGEVAWQGPPTEWPLARIAPDGSYFVVSNREPDTRRKDGDYWRRWPGRLQVMDRTGRVLASTKDVFSPRLEGISLDGRWILLHEADALGRWPLIVRDRNLTPAWMIGPPVECAISVEAGLIAAWNWKEKRVSVYRMPE